MQSFGVRDEGGTKISESGGRTERMKGVWSGLSGRGQSPFAGSCQETASDKVRFILKRISAVHCGVVPCKASASVMRAERKSVKAAVAPRG